MNVKFVLRGVLVGVPVALVVAAAGLALIVSQTPAGRPPAPTPLPPTILAPRGAPPAGPGGLQEWVQYRGETHVLAGSGFLLRLASGQVVGVTTAHSVSFDDVERPVEQIAFAVADGPGFVAVCDTLWGLPGRRLTPDNLVIDYVLLKVGQLVEPDLVLEPDSRATPQPGERVSLFSGLGDGQGGRRVLSGTVQSVSDTGVWVLMDDWFQPGMMSGSPFVSQHTGQVVGMAVAVTPRRQRLLLGMHPIGSLVQLAEMAGAPLEIDTYHR